MSGIPAGYEEEYDDDDYNFTESDFNDYLVKENSNNTGSVVAEQKLPKENVNKTESVFKQYKTVSKHLKDELNLDSENIRLAILDENIEYIKNILNKGFKPDTVLKSGWSALMYGASNGSLNIINLLLENHASVNFKSGSLSPIMVLTQSVKKGEDNIVSCAELLIKHGADINDHDKHIMTALMYSSQQGLSKFASLLCQHGAIVDVQESRGWTALCFAASNGYSHVVKVLLEHGSDHHITTLQGEKPADLAFSNGFTMLSELLEKYDGKNIDGLDSIPQKCSRLAKTGTAKYVNYGDLELFLFGLDLGHLVPVLQEQHLCFTQLLKLTENELNEAGITKLGDRKTLYSALQNVRSNDWDTSNLSNKDLLKLGTLDTAAVIANVTKHLGCIQSCVGYAHRMIDQKKDLIKEDNTNLQRTLIEQCQEAYKLSKELDKEISDLNSDVVKFFPDANKIEVDNIGDTHKTTKRSYMKTVIFTLATVGITTAGGFAVYKWLHKPL